MTTLETLRPSITNQDYLDRLYDMEIFEKKLDVWAYCVAHALGKGLEPVENRGSQMGSDLVHLDRHVLDTLVVAVQAKAAGRLLRDELLNELSSYASAGIADIRRKTEGKSRTETYEFLLGQVGPQE
ncbi:MAG: hypothetical protein ACOC6F_01235 [bacterium]